MIARRNLWIFISALAALVAASTLVGLAADYQWFKVTRVVDGDTIVLEDGTKVRLIGVDTPETVDPRKPVQFFGKEASDFTRSQLEGKQVRLEYDWQRTDKYGRTLAYVYQRDGTLFNAKLISEGYGHAYTKYPFKQEFMDQFRKLEREARENGRGLWTADSSAFTTSPTVAPASGKGTTGQYWMNSRSGVRHNSRCRYFGKTAQGYYTNEKEGRACGICGG